MVALRKSDFAGGRAGESERPPRDEISSHLFADETRLVGGLIERAVFTEDERRRTAERARTLVEAARQAWASTAASTPSCASTAYSSEEGVILMCLAEALLRIPDADTADRFIAEKIARRPVGAPSRPFRQPSRQRLDLGPDADRPPGQAQGGAGRQSAGKH